MHPSFLGSRGAPGPHRTGPYPCPEMTANGVSQENDNFFFSFYYCKIYIKFTILTIFKVTVLCL